MQKWIVPAAAAILLTGCVSATQKKTIDAQALSAVRNQKVVYTVRDKPNFMAMTPPKAALGLLGVAAMVLEGNQIIAENNVPDPAGAIANDLAGAMRSSHGVQVLGQPLRIDSEDPLHIADLAKGRARYVLDVQTSGWKIAYRPTDWTHYHVMYSAKARLIDVDARSVIAEASCRQHPDSNADAPTYDEMVAGGAARLKAELAALGAACTASIGRDMLAVQGPIAMPGGAIAGAAGNWKGYMACDARADNGPNAAAYEARFAMEVQGSTVTVYRRTANVVETLSGQVAGDRLELQGTGHRVADQTRAWRLRVSGAFPPGATSYQGKGAMMANGREIRKCELTMSRA